MGVRYKLFVLLFLLALSGTVVFVTLELSPKNYLTVNFLDVGQGDAILIETTHGGRILIDGGPGQAILTRLGEELPTLENKIDLVVATHDDADHIVGLISVLENYEVGVLLTSIPSSNSTISKRLFDLATSKNIKVVHITKPMIMKTSDGLIMKVLYPTKNMDSADDNYDGNTASIVTQFTYGQNRFLFTGDLYTLGERFLVSRYDTDLKSNILKLGHHGSDTSTSAEFLSKVDAEVAIVSAGANNSFGHPHPDVINLANKFGMQIFHTASGTQTFYSNGVNIWK